MSYYGKIQKRCPKCKSSRIYRRIRRDGLSKYNKIRRYRTNTLAKQYVCRNCGYEFNNPLIDLVYNIKKEILY